jgi:carbonic anhydrase
VLKKAVDQGISPQILQTLENSGIDLQQWLTGFDSPEDGVRKSVAVIRKHPLLPPGILVHGLMMDPKTGRLDVLRDGSKPDGD